VVEQDTPVVGLKPVDEVHPAGNVVVPDTAQDTPVVVLNPAFDVHPAGYDVVAQDVPVV
jgi:hypothetical protein